MRTLHTLPFDAAMFQPGMRLAVGLSGGADSVALTCVLAEQSRELGIVVHAAHLHHGLRGAEADADLEFSRALAGSLGLPFHESRVDTALAARRAPKAPGEAEGESLPADSIEGTARRLRYAWFRRLLAEVPLDAVATAHTFDDQAETVLAKFLRGAWTEGLSGIHPILNFPEGRILRPFLRTRRTEIEEWLNARSQPWREDSTNRHLTFTRNRIRHEILPLLESMNSQLRESLSQMAELARDEESWWESEVPRIFDQIALRGRPVRGGGRAATSFGGIALDLARLRAEAVAVQRRLLRHAAAHLEAALDFAGTEALRALAQTGRAGQKLELARGLRAERTHRELRITRGPVAGSDGASTNPEQYECVIPGELASPALNLRIRVDLSAGGGPMEAAEQLPVRATLRSWRAGDRVRLRYSSGPRKVKEVLERMKVTGEDRTRWPVLEIGGRILWMRGVEIEPDPAIQISVGPLD